MEELDWDNMEVGKIYKSGKAYLKYEGLNNGWYESTSSTREQYLNQ